MKNNSSDSSLSYQDPQKDDEGYYRFGDKLLTSEAYAKLKDQLEKINIEGFKGEMIHPENISLTIDNAHQSEFTMRGLMSKDGELKIVASGVSAASLIASVSQTSINTDLLSIFPPPEPMVITLIGSTKYKEAFERANERLSIAGHAVFSVCRFGHLDNLDMSGPIKKALDKSYMFKIATSDAVYVVNPDGYIGMGTCDELHYALALGKKIFWETEPDTWKEYYSELVNNKSI